MTAARINPGPMHYYVTKTERFVAGIPQSGKGNIYSNRSMPGTGKTTTLMPGTLTGKSAARTR